VCGSSWLLLVLLAPSPPLRGGEGWGEGALFTPLCGGESGTIRPRSGSRHGCRLLFARAGCPIEKPGPDSRTCRAQARQAPSGVAFSLATFSYSGHPALRPSGQLRCSHALQARAWPPKRKWLALRRRAKALALYPPSKAKASRTSALLQKSNSKSIATEVAPTSEGGRCAGAAGFCLCSWLPLPRFAGERAGERGRSSLPCAAVSRGRSGREAGIDMDVDAFSSGQESGRKARPRLTNLPGASPASAKRGGPLFGYFLLATQEKVARAPSGVRKLLLCIHHQEQEHRAQGALLQKSNSKSIAHRVRSYGGALAGGGQRSSRVQMAPSSSCTGKLAMGS